jgi:predicted amidohydrolase
VSIGGPVRVALAQMCAGTRIADNLDAIDKVTRAAARAGACYVQTPEMSVLFARDGAGLRAEMSPAAAEAALAALGDMAKMHGVALHVGSLPVPLDDGHFANRSVLFDAGGALVAHYDKIHLFDADVPGDTSYRESATYVAGTQAVRADVAGLRLGLSVCYDVRFGALYQSLAVAGAEQLAVPAAFTVPILAGAEDDAPGLVVAEIDPAAVVAARARVPALANRRAFSLSVNPDAPE